MNCECAAEPEPYSSLLLFDVEISGSMKTGSDEETLLENGEAMDGEVRDHSMKDSM